MSTCLYLVNSTLQPHRLQRIETQRPTGRHGDIPNIVSPPPRILLQLGMPADNLDEVADVLGPCQEAPTPTAYQEP